MRKRPRFVARALTWDTRELTEATIHAEGSPVEPYGIWDTERSCWVNRWGEPDTKYWATCRQVAAMRARDLRENLGVRA